MERQQEVYCGYETYLQRSNKTSSRASLYNFADKGDAKYSYAIKSWRDNWDELIVFFDFSIEIRKLFILQI